MRSDMEMSGAATKKGPGLATGARMLASSE
jgi:hypothetical protein